MMSEVCRVQIVKSAIRNEEASDAIVFDAFFSGIYYSSKSLGSKGISSSGSLSCALTPGGLNNPHLSII